MFSVYKKNKTEWMLDKINYVRSLRESLNDKENCLIVVKEIFDRIREDVNFYDFVDFKTSDLQRLTRYPYPVIAGIIELFKEYELFALVDDKVLRINESTLEFYMEPVENYVVLRTYVDGAAKEIVGVLIEQIWQGRICNHYKKIFAANEAQRKALKIEDMGIRKSDIFNIEKAFEIKTILSRGNVVCNSKKQARILSDKLEKLGEASDFMQRILSVSEFQEVTNRYDKQISRIKSHVDYESMNSDLIEMQIIIKDYKVLIENE